MAEPFADDGAVDVIVVSPALVPSVVRRVNVDAFDLAGVVGQQRLERDEVVALHDEVAALPGSPQASSGTSLSR